MVEVGSWGGWGGDGGRGVGRTGVWWEWVFVCGSDGGVKVGRGGGEGRRRRRRYNARPS